LLEANSNKMVRDLTGSFLAFEVLSSEGWFKKTSLQEDRNNLLGDNGDTMGPNPGLKEVQTSCLVGLPVASSKKWARSNDS